MTPVADSIRETTLDSPLSSASMRYSVRPAPARRAPWGCASPRSSPCQRLRSGSWSPGLWRWGGMSWHAVRPSR